MKRFTTLSTLTLASALALVGCGAGNNEGTTEATSEAATSAAAEPSATATSAAAVSEEHSEADTMFAQMMIPHHQQAVEMSETLLAKDDIPSEVRTFAQGVVEAQGPEIDQLEQMLQTWGEPTSMESAGMEGMDHGSGSGSGMDGMMTEEQMQQLEDAQGTEAARMYLEQMTTHHEGAIEMAQEEVDNGQNPQAVEMARKIVADQQAEITEMEELLQGLPS